MISRLFFVDFFPGLGNAGKNMVDLLVSNEPNR